MTFTAGSYQGIKLVFQARPGSSDIYEVFTSGQQFSYLTPPPTSKRTSSSSPSPQDQPRLPYYYNRGPSSPPHRHIKYFSPSPPQAAGNHVEDDSGFESLVTNVSDSGSVSSRLVMTSPGSKDFMSVEMREPAYQNLGPTTVRWEGNNFQTELYSPDYTRSKKSLVSWDKYRTEVRNRTTTIVLSCQKHSDLYVCHKSVNQNHCNTAECLLLMQILLVSYAKQYSLL